MADETVDACCIINLYSASDDLCSLLQAMASVFHVPQIVVEESLYVCRPDEEDERKTVREEIDLSPAVEDNLVQICDLQSPEENALFVHFAADLDDGEAACLAIAQARAWTVATDDRKAQRLAGESGIAVVTTPELMKRWADAESVSDEEVRTVLQRIRNFARFVPRRGSVLHGWWMKKLEG
ncbi:MAG: hypothetical protein H8E44_42150 [Planctomycetes bacterium]|nr:hypothetical protein [Planctomycetota bacterium]MBL7043269.1 hypothetical protein [Pirellulaceae bacterium]